MNDRAPSGAEGQPFFFGAARVAMTPFSCDEAGSATGFLTIFGLRTSRFPRFCSLALKLSRVCYQVGATGAADVAACAIALNATKIETSTEANGTVSGDDPITRTRPASMPQGSCQPWTF